MESITEINMQKYEYLMWLSLTAMRAMPMWWTASCLFWKQWLGCVAEWGRQWVTRVIANTCSGRTMWLYWIPWMALKTKHDFPISNFILQTQNLANNTETKFTEPNPNLESQIILSDRTPNILDHLLALSFCRLNFPPIPVILIPEMLFQMSRTWI